MQTAANAEAYLFTGDSRFRRFRQRNERLAAGLAIRAARPAAPAVGRRLHGLDRRQTRASAPQIGSASYAEGLAEACRVARKAGDLPGYQRYRDGVERCLQFTVTLQYTDANTQHFADWYRRRLVGGFHASHQDGNLRIDYTQHAVCALVQYLQYVSGE